MSTLKGKKLIIYKTYFKRKRGKEEREEGGKKKS